jgi:hypothetical protein
MNVLFSDTVIVLHSAEIDMQASPLTNPVT